MPSKNWIEFAILLTIFAYEICNWNRLWFWSMRFQMVLKTSVGIESRKGLPTMLAILVTWRLKMANVSQNWNSCSYQWRQNTLSMFYKQRCSAETVLESLRELLSRCLFFQKNFGWLLLILYKILCCCTTNFQKSTDQVQFFH